MSKGLLAQSLRDFSSDAWWAICDGFVDGDGMASEGALQLRVRQYTRLGDLRRAAASYREEDNDQAWDDVEEEGAVRLTDRILWTFQEQALIEQATSDEVWRVTQAYLNLHRLPEGGIRFAYNIDGSWTTYDAEPAPIREARRQASTDRLNTTAAIKSAANYQRPVQTGEERSAKYATAKRAAFELYESLLQHGYLDAFPVTVNQDGRVVSGNHRLRFAELARAELMQELAERGRANGNDLIEIADLERRIASLDRQRILSHAIVVSGDSNEVRVTTASEIQIPWADHERKQLAKRLATDGLSVGDIADRLGRSERTVREWTMEERTDVKQVQQAEAGRLYDAGWAQRKIAEHLGVTDHTVRRWVRDSGEAAEITHRISEPKTVVEQPTTTTPAPEPDPPRDMTPAAVNDRIRQRLEQVKELDSRVRPRWTLSDVEDIETALGWRTNSPGS